MSRYIEKKKNTTTISIVLGPSSSLYSHFVSCQLGCLEIEKMKKNLSFSKYVVTVVVWV
jgi:hypothetical protein